MVAEPRAISAAGRAATAFDNALPRNCIACFAVRSNGRHVPDGGFTVLLDAGFVRPSSKREREQNRERHAEQKRNSHEEQRGLFLRMRWNARYRPEPRKKDASGRYAGEDVVHKRARREDPR